MSRPVCIHGFVSGKVQGVFFRACTKERAIELNLTGWVKNTSDDRVEFYVCGDQDRIVQFTEWLWQGSPNADVTNVDWQEAPYEEYAKFSVIHG